MSRSRGFTLLELMVSAGTMTVVLAAVAGTFIATQRAYQHESQAKLATENARQANSYVEGLVRLAGYGIDPRFAFDFGAGSGVAKDNVIVSGLPANRPVVVTDDLAFRYRNPGWVRRGYLQGTQLNLVATAETVQNTLGVSLRNGQPLIISCRGGTGWLVVRANATGATGNATLALRDYGGAPFDAVGTLSVAPACARDETNPAYVMLLHEVRLRIVRLGTGAEARPFLVAFNNLNPSVDPQLNGDFDPIAAEVENFQVAYVMNRPTGPVPGGAPVAPDAGGNGNWILGDEGDPQNLLPSAQAVRPGFDTAYNDALRFTADPSNIRAVRLTLVTRSQRAPVRNATAAFAVENWQPTPAQSQHDGYYRSATHSQVRLPNMQSRSFFTPPLRPTVADTRDLNYAGG